jgi:hypothetical protein
MSRYLRATMLQSMFEKLRNISLHLTFPTRRLHFSPPKTESPLTFRERAATSSIVLIHPDARFHSVFDFSARIGVSLKESKNLLATSSWKQTTGADESLSGVRMLTT